MAGANNKALAKAGMSKASIEKYRAEPTSAVRMRMSAHSVTMAHSPEKQAAVRDFRAAAAARFRQAAADSAIASAKVAQLKRADLTSRSLRDVVASVVARRQAAAHPGETFAFKKGYHGAYGDVSMRLPMPKLEGTPKQIAWAERLRREAVRREVYRLVESPNNAKRVSSDPKLAVQFQAKLANVLVNERSARAWIDVQGRSRSLFGA